MEEDNKVCFVIAPIGETGSETRKRSDQVLKHIIRPAVESYGYSAVRADEIESPGMITSQVIQHVVDDALVVADLTDRNPNVFYELAIRHALRKPLVQIIRQGDAIPFDVAGTRTVFVDHTDLDSVDNAKQEIKKQIESLEGDSSDIQTPISVSLDLQLMRQSAKPEEHALADVLATVVDLRSGLSKIERRIGTKDRRGLLDNIQDNLQRLRRRLDGTLERLHITGMRIRPQYPMALREYLLTAPRTTPGMGILIIASMFRDSMPWLYEMGIEAYRLARSGANPRAKKAAREFREAVMFAFHGEMASYFIGQNEQMSMISEDIEGILNRAIGMLDGQHAVGR